MGIIKGINRMKSSDKPVIKKLKKGGYQPRTHKQEAKREKHNEEFLNGLLNNSEA